MTKRVSSLPVIRNQTAKNGDLSTKNKPVYEEIDVLLDEEGDTGTLQIATNRIEPIVRYKIASAKLPYQPPATRIMKKAYHRQSTPKFLPAIPKSSPTRVQPTITVEKYDIALTESQYIEKASDKD